MLELFVFVKVSGAIGFFRHVADHHGSMLGVLVLRVARPGDRATPSSLNRERTAQTMLEGLMMALAGGLLILPGFISDVLGLNYCCCRSPASCWPANAPAMLKEGRDTPACVKTTATARGGPAPRLGREGDVIEGVRTSATPSNHFTGTAPSVPCHYERHKNFLGPKPSLGALM